MEMPKAMIIEKIRSRSGTEAADRADKELPDKVDLDSDAELLQEVRPRPGRAARRVRGTIPSRRLGDKRAEGLVRVAASYGSR